MRLSPRRFFTSSLFSRRSAERSENPYSTHLPVLVGIARLFSVRRVLEFGSGEYSTLAFLDCAAFPDLVSLRSFENDAVWMRSIEEATRHDPRIKLTFVDGSMSSVVHTIEFQGYDLVFIDDSVSADSRAATIREVASRCDPSNVIVVHDFEIQAYREAAKSFPNRYTFTALNPNTGIVWNEVPLGERQLRRLNALIRRFSKHVQPEDVNRWIHIISRRRWKKREA